LLIERMRLMPTVQRLPIFGLGCAGGVVGLARAATIAAAMPDKAVLFVIVELCSLTFRRGDRAKSNIVAAALFGGGRAALRLQGAGATLGRRWTTRIIVLPGTPLVEGGPYRYLRHPNYVIVAGVVMVLPLAFGVALIALVFSAGNLALIARRVSIENRALAAYRQA